MSLFPKITFNDNTDYSAVYDLVENIYSYIQYKGVCCQCKPVRDVLIEVDGLLQDIVEDDSYRFKLVVQSAYLLLYPKTDC